MPGKHCGIEIKMVSVVCHKIAQQLLRGNASKITHLTRLGKTLKGCQRGQEEGHQSDLGCHYRPKHPPPEEKMYQKLHFSHISICCDLDYPTNFQNPPIRAFRDNRILLFSNGAYLHPPMHFQKVWNNGLSN